MRIFEFKEGGEWLRYVLWAAALSMGILFYSTLIDDGANAIMSSGAFIVCVLLGLSGFSQTVRRVVVDPVARTLIFTNRGFRSRSVETIAFSDIQVLSLVEKPVPYEYSEFSSVRTPKDTEYSTWSVLLVLADRMVPINSDPFATRGEALHIAEEVGRRTGLGIRETRTRR